MTKNILIIVFLVFCCLDIFAQIASNSRYATFEIDAPQLNGKRKIWIYLPLNYQKSIANYPVIYMHDGQNLFDEKTAFAGVWAIDKTLDELKANVIVVGIANGGDKRMEELTPFPYAKHGGGSEIGRASCRERV